MEQLIKDNNCKEDTIKLEEINQKKLIKEGRFKRYQYRIQKYEQNSTFQNNKSRFY